MSSENDAPITELDIRMIAHALHDQGRGHVLVDMVEGATGERPPDDAFSPRKMRIRNAELRAGRDKAKRKKYRAKCRANMTEQEKAKQIADLHLERSQS
jgi:hypothetical protein